MVELYAGMCRRSLPLVGISRLSKPPVLVPVPVAALAALVRVTSVAVALAYAQKKDSLDE